MLKLYKHPDPILQQIMPDFDFDNPVMNPHELEEQMVTLMAEANGRGLSANQVGITARVFTMITQNLEGVTTPFAVFNPKIIAEDPESTLGEEGCLSFPNLFFQVKRPEHIVVEFLDRDKNPVIIRLDGIDARCFLHELDHLNGICFTDKVSKLKLDIAIKKQRKLNGRAKPRTSISI
jgi:peptide deformylase